MEYSRTDLRKLCVKILHNTREMPLNKYMFAQTDILGIKISLKYKEIRRNSVISVCYICETDSWIIKFCVGTPEIQTVITDDIEKFERDICLIKMALA